MFERAEAELDRYIKDWQWNEPTGEKEEGRWDRVQVVSDSEEDQSRRWHRSCRPVRVPTCFTVLGRLGKD